VTKHVISVSLGSSKRDHTVTVEILGEEFTIERRGTDGDQAKAIALIKELDGKVDAFGLGGTDLYLSAANRRYILRSSLPLVQAAQKTPIVDGSGLKNTLERRAIKYLEENEILKFTGRRVLVVSAMDRFGMAEALEEAGANLILGDLIFSLGINIPVHSIKTIARLARILMPVISRLPLSVIYPTGEKQEQIEPKYLKYYEWAEIVAGDFHYIRRYLPPRIEDKIIVTNTVTAEDVALLKERGAAMLVTTTPELKGRSFGTNVMEAVLVAASGKRPEDLSMEDYHAMLEKIGFVPRVERLS